MDLLFSLKHFFINKTDQLLKNFSYSFFFATYITTIKVLMMIFMPVTVRESDAGVTIQSDLEGILNLKVFSC